MSGLLAWLAWLFVHLMKLVEYENRMLVFVQWAWAHVSYNRAARLITGDRLLPEVGEGRCSCGEWLGGAEGERSKGSAGGPG
jgi:hypothetical protein